MKISIFDDPKIYAANPWWQTKYGKKAKYVRNPPPWDKRLRGVDALTADQKVVNAAFSTASTAAAEKCEKGKRMQTNICRIDYIYGELKGKKVIKGELKKP